MKKLLLFLLLIPAVYARSYYISDAEVNVTVLDNGLVNVVENMVYSFEGCYSVVFSEIPVINSRIIAFKGSSDSSFSPYSGIEDGYFFYEFQFSSPQCDNDVSTVLEYNMSGVIDSYDDVSGLHFMFWPDNAPFAESLTANIKLPNDIVNYWIHNRDKSSSISSNNEIIFIEKNVNPGIWIETQVVFERLNDNTYSVLKTGNGSDLITEKENYYEAIIFFSLLLSAVFLAAPFLLFYFIYKKYGAEEPAGFFNEFDIPTHDSPAVVRAILDNAYSYNINSFVATIFDLAKREYFSILGSEKNVEIKILRDNEGLNSYENIVYLFLKKYSENDIVKWNELKVKILSTANSQDFETRLNLFNKEVNKGFERKEYYNNEGNIKFLSYSAVFIGIFYLASFALDFASALIMPNYYNYSGISFFVSLGIIILLNIVGIFILGRWTSKGRVFEQRWGSFKKYLNDYSMLSAHPAQSIVVWERFLVYAIALGVANNVIKVMKLKLGDVGRTNLSGAYYLPHFYSSLNRSLMTSYNARSGSYGHSSFGGGRGGFGGGHGGGSRGAR